MDGLGHDIDVVCSIGPLSVHFSDVEPEMGRDDALFWNEEMAGARINIRAVCGPAPPYRFLIHKLP